MGTREDRPGSSSQEVTDQSEQEGELSGWADLFIWLTLGVMLALLVTLWPRRRIEEKEAV